MPSQLRIYEWNIQNLKSKKKEKKLITNLKACQR